MLDRTIVLGTIAACMLATPVAAQAPAPTTAFDGTYVGVSRTLQGYQAETQPHTPSRKHPPTERVLRGTFTKRPGTACRTASRGC
jgi:hypothetical protein